MKATLLFFSCIFFSFGIQAQEAQEIIGAWERSYKSSEKENLKTILIVSKNHHVLTTYNADTGAFIETKGGSWTSEGDKIKETVEFDSKNPESVGTEIKYTIAVTDSLLEFVGGKLKMKRIDNGTTGALQGAWLMSGRTVDGETQLRDIDTPRKTMKILSGTRFQWIAYNTEKKKFMATGGGSYTTKDGIYTENIEFFSKDIEKVGLQLKFDYNLQDGNWHHSGSSTKGDPIDEVWTQRQ